MFDLFGECENLLEIDVSKFDTSRCTEMTYMFSGCSQITSLNLTNFKTNKVTGMNGLFSQCIN